MIPANFKARVVASLLKFSTKHKVTAKAQKAIIAELNRDRILPMLKLNSKTKVTIAMGLNPRTVLDVRGNEREVEGESSIELQIGSRDWSFDAETGECFGAGTCL